ncbi:hemin uptake protein HemP [Parasulfitobacter algicola]|uniref:Hemin uptake protein HemP n=1 Tax=Parasulfitobacter algicola TaxID=2614809 RepID=A0ABX2IVG8_9RHOB|nr:hemin uptake protein HemP [Sulfitobacter algicola]NSX54276.1 hemin uptake protein HemP [Sulfitobacter algicola]
MKPTSFEIAQTTDRPQSLPSYNARSLVGDGVQAHIVLDNQLYVLRITRAGKLILTK